MTDTTIDETKAESWSVSRSAMIQLQRRVKWDRRV